MQQAGGVGVVWDDELQRVAQWLSSKKRQREQQQTTVLARVNTHLQFVHAYRREQELEAEEDDLLDEDDSDRDGVQAPNLGLDFLDDVNADDLKSLLEAEAARTSGAASTLVDVAVATTASTHAPEGTATTGTDPNVMALIEMPSHLLAKSSPPRKLYASPAENVQLQPKFVVPPPPRLPSSAAAALTKKVSVTSLGSTPLDDEDAGVAELMNELDLDISDVVHHLPHDPAAHCRDREEHKMEESTPPHLRGERPTGAAEKHSRTSPPSSAMEALARSVFSTPSREKTKRKKSRNFVRDGSDDSDLDGSGRPVERARSAHPHANPDDVGDEMRSWVTGYRDPEVLRRKEAMSQRNRKPTARFGVNSVEEQRYINKAAKYYAEGKGGANSGSDSDSSSSASYGSDFSPDEVDDPDDPVSDVELLSDDYLDDSAEVAASSSSRAKPRRRLRNQHEGSKPKRKAGGATKRKQKKASAGRETSSSPRTPTKRSGGAAELASVGRGGATENGGAATPDRAQPSSDGRVADMVDLLSSDDGSDYKAAARGELARPSGYSSARIPSGVGGASQARTNGQSKSDAVTRAEKAEESMILRLNIPKSVPESAAQAADASKPASREAVEAVEGLERVRAEATAASKATKSTVKAADSRHETAELGDDMNDDADGAQQPDVSVDFEGDHSDAGTADLDDDAADQPLAVTSENGEHRYSEFTLATESSDRVDCRASDAASAGAPKLSDAATPEEKKSQTIERPVELSETSLAKHNLVENSAAKPSETQDNADNDDSEAETLNFDDIEEMSNDDVDFDFGGESSRQEDLGFSDNGSDNGGDDATPAIVAPHDDEYEQFFDETPLRKLKVKQKQQEDRKKAGENAQTASSKAAESAACTTGSKPVQSAAKPLDPKFAVPANGAKSKASSAAVQVKESSGSNGLQKATKPPGIATATALKGKFENSRRSIKVIVDGVGNFERGKRSVSGIYSSDKLGAKKKSRFSEPLVRHHEIQSSVRLTEEFISSISSPERRPRVDQRTTKPANGNGNGSSKSSRDEDESRYLSYGSKAKNDGAKPRGYDSDDEPLSTSASRAAKARFGDKDSTVLVSKVGSSRPEKSSSSWTFLSMVSTSADENVDSNPQPKAPAFQRERQIGIYDALHIDGQEENGLTSRDLRDGEYKRPSAFKKAQQEKEKRGISFVPREKFLENAPIPKKKKVPTQQQQQLAKTPPDSDARSNGSSDKRSSLAKPPARQKESHYGPSSGEPASKSNGNSYQDRGSDKSSYSSSSKKKSKGKKPSSSDKSGFRQSLSPVSRRRSSDPDWFSSSHSSRSKDVSDRGRRCEQSRSRSRSPRGKHDHYGASSDESSRKRHRSLSRSRSRDRDERNNSGRLRNDERDRDRSRSVKDARDFGKTDEKSLSRPAVAAGDRTGTSRSSSESRDKRGRSLDRTDVKYALPRKVNDMGDPRAVKRAKTTLDPRLEPTQSDFGRRLNAESSYVAPVSLYDSGSDIYISDSDGEQDGNGNGVKKAVDIRINLESVPVDQRQMKRRVYVSGINGMMDEEVLEELFAPFGIETDRENGFPAIDMFMCQRSLRPRGDACVTFSAEEGAISAVEEINAKIVKNCQIEVRRMDSHTQRVLNAQFLSARELWKCAGADCGADTSVWNNKCGRCSRKRMFGPSRVRIATSDWLCSVCFTANADLSAGCHTCSATLPPTNRAQFYKN